MTRSVADMRRQVAELDARRQALLAEVATRREKYEAARAKFDPRIAQYSNAADALAVQFKQLVRDAADAYARDEKELASQLAQERRAKQAQCEEMNGEANELRRKLGTKLDKLKGAQAALAGVNDELRSTRSLIRASIPTTIKGLHLLGLSPHYLEDVMDRLPKSIWQNTESVTYVAALGNGGILGLTEVVRPEAKITLFRSPLELKVEDLNALYAGVIEHEAGHVVFQKLMSSGERFAWSRLWQATRLGKSGTFVNRRAMEHQSEDFAECFRMYRSDPQGLKKVDPTRYNFVKNVYNRL